MASHSLLVRTTTDVEGAEERVFRTMHASRFGVVMAEADGTDPPKDERVLRHGRSGGLRLSQRVRVRASNILLRSDVNETLVNEIPQGYIGSSQSGGLENWTIFKFAPSHQRMRDEIFNALNPPLL